MDSERWPAPVTGSLTRRPSLPTTVLPRLPRSLTNSHPKLTVSKLRSLINHLRLLYRPTVQADPSETNEHQSGASSASVLRTATHIDSGYISEIEEDEPDTLREHNILERSFAKEWLLSLVKRSAQWCEEVDQTDERNAREQLAEEAAALVASFAETSASGSILRPLLLPTCGPADIPQSEPLLITLNDALPSSLDATSVGLQSWGSSILLARKIALNPEKYGLGALYPGQRALELGAGTGLLSLVWKGMSERVALAAGKTAAAEVVATDYHEGVLENLRKNVAANSPAITPAASPAASPLVRPADAAGNVNALSTLPSSFARVQESSSASSSGINTPTAITGPPVAALKLDWSAIHTSRVFATTSRGSLSLPPPFDRPFRTVLAADVVYGPEHAMWLKSCVEQFLEKPDELPRMPKLRRNSSSRSRTGSISGASAFATPPLLSLSSITPLPLSLSPMPTPAAAGTPTLTSSPPSFSPQNSAPVSPALRPVDGALQNGMTLADLPEPCFHLIVPCRPTHVAAIASIADAFPSEISLPERQPGEPWRLAVRQLEELQRVKGVGRADEEKYRLYRIGWC